MEGRYRVARGVAVAANALLAAASLFTHSLAWSATSTPPWVFVSSPDWFNEDVADLSGATPGVPRAPGWPRGASGGVNGISPEMKLVYDQLVAEMASYGPQAFLVAGDLINGRWLSTPALDMFDPVGRNPAVALDRAAGVYFAWYRQQFAKHGISLVLAAPGDHEFGDDPWPPGSSEAKFVPARRRAFARHFVDVLGLPPLYRGVPSRPGDGTDFASYAYRLNNVLLVSVDEFRQQGASTVIHPIGKTVSFDVGGTHLGWLAGVLTAADSDPAVDHVVVQGHMPVLDPIRMQTTSGAMLVDREHSALWQLLRQHDHRHGGKVRLYLGGEVHAATVVLDAGSDVVQVVHGDPPRMLGERVGGARPGQYAVFTIHPERIDVELRRFDLETNGTSRYWQLDDRVASGYEVTTGPSAATGSSGAGTLAVETGSAGTVVTGTGWLTPVRSAALAVHFGFDARTPARDLSNTGAFGDVYYEGIERGRLLTVVGKFGNALKFDGSSGYVDSGRGSIAEGEVRTAAAWLKTSAGATRTILSYGNKRAGLKPWFDLLVRAGIPRIEIGPSTYCYAKGAPLVNNGNWHHVAVVLQQPHENRCADARFYIDGVPYASSGGESVLYTTPWADIRIGVSHLGNTSWFLGVLDDVALWHAPLSAAKVRGLVNAANDPALRYDAAQMESLFAIYDSRSGTATVGDRQWRYATGFTGKGGTVLKAADVATILLDEQGRGVTTSGAAPPEAVYEAELATLGGAVFVARSGGGFTGTGFADFRGEGYIQWTVSTPAAGSYELLFRYALGRSDRALAISINGAVVIPKLNFAKTGVTGDWSVWTDLGVTRQLPAGTHVIRAASTGRNGPNMDHLRLVGP